jgi:hypothetical protein
MPKLNPMKNDDDEIDLTQAPSDVGGSCKPPAKPSFNKIGKQSQCAVSYKDPWGRTMPRGWSRRKLLWQAWSHQKGVSLRSCLKHKRVAISNETGNKSRL